MPFTIASFSFKQGVPADANMVFDVRFLTNPHYDPNLQPLNGLDPKVGAYIEADPDFAGFFTRLTGFLEPLLKRFLSDERQAFVIAIGCTGGQHRSVHVAQKLTGFLREKGYNVSVEHRGLKS